jgi:hypothetical protein
MKVSAVNKTPMMSSVAKEAGSSSVQKTIGTEIIDVGIKK